MSQTEPTLAAPMAPSRIDFAAMLARQAERDARVTALRPANKERLFDGLTAAGITHVTVVVDGYGDSGQIESISAWAGETTVDFPKIQIESPRVCWRGLCSNVMQLFDLGSSFHKMPPLLLGAGHSRWHCAAVLSCTS